MMVDQIISFDIVSASSGSHADIQVLASGEYLKGVTKDDPKHADLFWVRHLATMFHHTTDFRLFEVPQRLSVS